MTDTTETPRNEAGQFESPDSTFGREGLERAAGFVPLKDEPAEQPEEFATVKEAAEERLKQLSGREGAIKTWTAVDLGLDDNNSLTPEQAGKKLAMGRRDEAASDPDKADEVEAEQKRIDKLRGVDPAKPTETEDEVERAFKIPKVKEAFDAKIGEVETQRQHHEAAAAHATNFAVASLLADVPELANLHPDNWAAAINEMSPDRAAVAASRLRALGQVEAANQKLKAEKTARDQATLKEYTEREHARYLDLIKDIPARDQVAISKHLPKMFAEYGVNTKQFIDAIANQTAFPRSVAQALLVKAVRYDLMTKTAKAMPSHDLPPVLRPGVAGPRVSGGEANLAKLNAKFSNSRSLKDAAALLSARRNSKGK